MSQPTASRAALTLAALGVVFGDIGTSPLYALRECFHGPHGIEPNPANVLGVLSLIFWALVIVISVKYVSYVMRAANHGEGGILALMALIPSTYRGPHSRGVLLGLGLFGAALLYGDGVITPAISVLGAVEGLSTATPALTPYVVPISVVILFGLFLLQYRGTASVGAMFGPVMIVWFVVIAAMGVRWISLEPHVLSAVNPVHAVRFFAANGYHGFVVLGSVFLVVTGGEALYADMGHFGAGPIRLAWFAMVFPGLILNYFGQGALLLQHPEAAEHVFYRMAPTWLVVPLVILATAAACIASQALISAVFSLTRQAVQLGYSPRVEIRHTSHTTMGQIYIPTVNWALMLATIALVLLFQSSSALAAAYGIAVTATMGITTLLAYVVARQIWGWSRWVAGGVTAVFIVIDFAFFGANLLKLLQGGWVPLAMAGFVYLLMSTWKGGRKVLGARLREKAYPLGQFLKELPRSHPDRVPGSAIFMTGSGAGVPPTLLHNLRHNKVLHASNVLLTVMTEEIPVVPDERRVEIEPLGSGFYRVTLRYGFVEEPDVPAAITLARGRGLPIDKDDITYFLGRETLLATARESGMARWREALFSLMSKNAMRATAFFRIPPERVVELGMHVEL
jgi:KUP system potassium uptake protein